MIKSRMRKVLAAPLAVLLGATLSVTLTPGVAQAAPTTLSIPGPPSYTYGPTAEITRMKQMAALAEQYITTHPTTYSMVTTPQACNGGGRGMSDLALIYAVAFRQPSSINATVANPNHLAAAKVAVDNIANAVNNGHPKYLSIPAQGLADGCSLTEQISVPDYSLTMAQTAEAAWLIWDQLAGAAQTNVLNALKKTADYSTGVGRPNSGGQEMEHGPGMGDVAWYRGTNGAIPHFGRGDGVIGNCYTSNGQHPNNGCSRENSAGEEQQWHERLTNVAVRMLSGLSQGGNVPHYERFQIAYGLHGLAKPTDLSRQDVINGQPMCKWFKGSNVENNGIMINHDVRSPNYSRTPSAYFSWAFNGLAGTRASAATLFGTVQTFGSMFDGSIGTPYRTTGNVYWIDGNPDRTYGGSQPFPATKLFSVTPGDFTNNLQGRYITGDTRAGNVAGPFGQNVQNQQDQTVGSTTRGAFYSPNTSTYDFGWTLDVLNKFVTTHLSLSVNQFQKPSLNNDAKLVPYSGTAC